MSKSPTDRREKIIIIYTAKEGIQNVAKGGFEIDFIMLVAAIVAAILGGWADNNIYTQKAWDNKLSQMN